MKRLVTPRFTMTQLLLLMALCSIGAAVYRTAVSSRLGFTPEIVALSPSGRFLIIRSEVGLSVVDVQASDARWRLLRDSRQGKAYQPKFVDDTTAVFSIEHELTALDKIEIWDTQRRQLLHAIELPVRVAAFSISRERRLLLVSSRQEQQIHLFDIDTGTRVCQIPGSRHGTAQLSSDGNYVYVSSTSRYFQKWDVRDLQNPIQLADVPVRKTQMVRKRPSPNGTIHSGYHVTRLIRQGNTSLRFDTDGKVTKYTNDVLVAESAPGIIVREAARHQDRWAASEDMNTLVVLSNSKIRGRDQFTLQVIDTDRMEVIHNIGQTMYVREVTLFSAAIVVCVGAWSVVSTRNRKVRALQLPVSVSMKLAWVLLAVAALWIIVLAQLQMFEILTHRDIVQATLSPPVDKYLDHADFWDRAAPISLIGGVLILMQVGNPNRRWLFLALAILGFSLLRTDVVASSLFITVLLVLFVDMALTRWRTGKTAT